MSESKHTPGPWKYSEDLFAIYGDNGRQVIRAVGARNEDLYLILAAPELYEALKGFVLNKVALKTEEPFEGALEKLLSISEELISRLEAA